MLNVDNVSASQPLWLPDNHTIYSSIFNVPHGLCAVLFATGLGPEKYRVNADEFITPQTICVKRILHDYRPYVSGGLRCDWVFDIDNIHAIEVDSENIQTCKGPWAFLMCDNLRIIGVPGTYRLELNDSSAVHKVQVFADLVDVNKLHAGLSPLFF